MKKTNSSEGQIQSRSHHRKSLGQILKNTSLKNFIFFGKLLALTKFFYKRTPYIFLEKRNTTLRATALTISLATIFLMGCGSAKQEVSNLSSSTSGIIGGVIVTQSSVLAKSVVGIYDDNGGFTCSGSLLPNNLVVTAAHCIGDKADGVFIVFSPDMESLLKSESDFSKFPTVRRVVALKAHEKWTQQQDSTQPGNDIGLMQYSGSTPEGYVPAKLLTDTSMLKPGASVVLAGYGVNSDKVVRVNPKTPGLQDLIDRNEVICDSKDAKTAKQCVKEDLNGPAVLKATMVVINKIDNPYEAILDEAHGHAACSGDSGGPAYVKVGNEYQLWGATSRSAIGCNTDITYTNILPYTDWINTTAEGFKHQ